MLGSLFLSLPLPGTTCGGRVGLERRFGGGLRVEDAAGVQDRERHLGAALHADAAHHDEALALRAGRRGPGLEDRA